MGKTKKAHRKHEKTVETEKPIENIKITDQPLDDKYKFKYFGIQLPLLEMTQPYYPYSMLAKSIFSGYYILFFMYTFVFIAIYPVLNYMNGDDFFGITVIKVVETNLIWDFIGLSVFLFLAFVFAQIATNLPLIPLTMTLTTIALAFLGIGNFIVRTYDMYFTDRIFITVLSWGFCVKTMTLVYDKFTLFNSKNISTSAHNISMEKQKKMNSFKNRLLYLISPTPIYHVFIREYNPELPIHYQYLALKFFGSFTCMLLNNILIVKFIEPACQQSDLSFLALTFKLIPLTFYINMALYYMVMDSVIAAMAEITQMTNRVFYLDWWNASTIHEFINRWCLIMTSVFDTYFPQQSQRTKCTANVAVLLLLLLTIFGRSLTSITLLGFSIVLLFTYFLGGARQIQNNYVVHLLTMSFTPVLIALQVKYDIFNQAIMI